MDIHRCRFVQYQPQSINTLAFSHIDHHPKHKSPAQLRLALGRENGDIEIWNPLGGVWSQEKILRGSCDRTVEQVTWTQGLAIDEDNKESPIADGAVRLFSSGGSKSITEWNLTTGVPVRHEESNAGEIWCFAAQPQWKWRGNPQESNLAVGSPTQLLAAGCSNGSIVLFSTAEDDLKFIRVLVPGQAKKSVKVISITWRDRNTIFAGHENGIIKAIDVPSRKVLRTMSLGKVANETCIVWAVKCLPNGTILSGDSSGELKVWDAKTLSLTQRLKTHEADILDIATSSNGDIVFTTGVDRRTVTYRPISGPNGSRKDRWQSTMHRRYHQHDVKALATFESKEMSVVVSGGMDTTPVVMPLRNADSEYHRSLGHLPQKPQISCSTKSRLMVTWWNRDLFIFHLPRRMVDGEVPDHLPYTGTNHKLVAHIQVQGEENIASAQISDNGKFVIASTSVGARLFQLRKRNDLETGEVEVRARSLDLPLSLRAFGASQVGFSPDNKWLYAVRTSNIVVLAKMTVGSSIKEKPSIHDKAVKLAKKLRSATGQIQFDEYIQSINCVSFSSDSRIIAVGDLSGVVDTWILDGHEDTTIEFNSQAVVNGNISGHDSASESDSDDSSDDSDDESDYPVIHGQKWIALPGGSRLPQLDSAILSLSFKPSSPQTQDTEATLGLHPTRHNPHPIAHEIPSQEVKLVAVTALHSIVQFDVLSSKLSDWSRRNPSSYLPLQFTQIKDRIMGSFWDCSPASATSNARVERLWLYGSNWLFMLDMSRDLAIGDALEKVGKLGKYDVKEPLSSALASADTIKSASEARSKKRKRNTGAGDQIKEGEWQRVVHPKLVAPTKDAEPTDENNNSQVQIPLEEEEFDSDDDMISADTDALALLRRNRDQNPSSTMSESATPKSKSKAKHSRANSNGNNDQTESNTARDPNSPPYFLTFRYRSIFGVAVLSPSPNTSIATSTSSPSDQEDDDDDGHSGGNSGLEVVIVERPMYDITLLPRFDGGQDWGS